MDDGKEVTFADLGVSRDGLTYKGKSTEWRDVTSMVIVVKQGSRSLTVRQRGAIFAWCSVNMNELPNNELLCRTALPQLLKTEESR